MTIKTLIGLLREAEVVFTPSTTLGQILWSMNRL
jgi:hypothetical protein